MSKRSFKGAGLFLRMITLGICLLGTVGICLLGTVVYTRSPQYVHTQLTPIYEKEAIDFFEDNKALLMQLSNYSNDLTTTYQYTFNTRFEIEGIPEDIVDILHELEGKTDKCYFLKISQGSVRIEIADGAYFRVLLYYGPPSLHGIKSEWEKTYVLENGWTVESPYIIRG